MEAARQMYFLFLYCWRSARGYWLVALSDVQGAETLPSPGEQVDGVDDEYPHAYHHHDVYCHIHGEALFDDCVDNVTAFKHVPGGLNSSRYPVTNFFTCFFSSRRIRAVHPTARGVAVFLRKRISTSHHLLPGLSRSLVFTREINANLISSLFRSIRFLPKYIILLHWH